jgi:hypothetical protein
MTGGGCCGIELTGGGFCMFISAWVILSLPMPPAPPMPTAV